jgi:3-hydroxy-9,10-secoandrosta-1,3,5(10)-triene-9,17-dione monooxygenase
MSIFCEVSILIRSIYKLDNIKCRGCEAACALVVELLGTALDKIMFVGGSSAFARSNDLQRFWRDFNMAARHAIYLPDFGYEVYGALRLGLNQTAVPPNLI